MVCGHEGDACSRETLCAFERQARLRLVFAPSLVSSSPPCRVVDALAREHVAAARAVDRAVPFTIHARTYVRSPTGYPDYPTVPLSARALSRSGWHAALPWRYSRRYRTGPTGDRPHSDAEKCGEGGGAAAAAAHRHTSSTSPTSCTVTTRTGIVRRPSTSPCARRTHPTHRCPVRSAAARARATRAEARGRLPHTQRRRATKPGCPRQRAEQPASRFRTQIGAPLNFSTH